MRLVGKQIPRALTLTLTILATLACACAPAGAQPPQSATLHATFTPERLGQETTLGFSFQVNAPRGEVPSPLVSVSLSYPNDVGVTISELGLQTCKLAALVASGLSACPVNSRMGVGSATVEIALGPLILSEQAHIDVVRAPEQNGRLALIFNTEGVSPVDAELALPAVLQAAEEPFGGKVAIDLPIVPGLPEAPDLAVVHLQASIGPAQLTYYEHVHGKLVGFRPHRIKLPRHCPRGGFPFEASFVFQDGLHTMAQTTVPCPTSAGRHSRPRAHA